MTAEMKFEVTIRCACGEESTVSMWPVSRWPNDVGCRGGAGIVGVTALPLDGAGIDLTAFSLHDYSDFAAEEHP